MSQTLSHAFAQAKSADRAPRFSDALPSGAALLRAAFNVRLHGDIHERAADWGVRLPLGAKRQARLNDIKKQAVLFIHVPKNAGTSISTLLYGANMRHETMRYYRHVARGFDIPSFAIWRDPVERFCSAFDFARQGGGSNVRLSPAFASIYTRFQTLDCALDHLERCRTPYDMDYVFRPQSWFVCDRAGKLIVDRLFSLRNVALLPQRIDALRGRTIPHLNDSVRSARIVTPAQEARIRALYASDEMLRPHLEAA